MPDLSGTRALITGAGGGLGREVAVCLTGWGARIAALDVDEESLASVRPGVELTRPLDVTDETGVRSAFEWCLEQLGGLDLLVNGAGVLSVSNVARMELQDWRRVIEINLTGTFLCSREAVRAMIARQSGGSIVSIASIGGKLGDPGLAHYSASKFGVIGFTQALAREVGEAGIRVNAVCPGVVETPMIEVLADGWHSSVGELVEHQVIKRPQTGTEIASAIAFLHTNESITGQAINVDGGTVFH